MFLNIINVQDYSKRYESFVKNSNAAISRIMKAGQRTFVVLFLIFRRKFCTSA
jgi:hypothetical protein